MLVPKFRRPKKGKSPSKIDEKFYLDRVLYDTLQTMGHHRAVYPLKGSLTRRILLISLCLLVLPLLVHSFYLYREEYKLDLEDAKRTLETFGAGRFALLEEEVEDTWLELDAIVMGQVDGIGAFGVERGVVDRKEEKFLSVHGTTLIVGRKIKENEALLKQIPLQKWLKPLEHALFPAQVSFLNEDKKIFLSSQNGYVGHSVILSKKEWICQIGKEKVIANRIDVPGVPISFLFTIPESVIAGVQLQYYLPGIAVFLSVLIGIGGGATWILLRRLSRPLKELSRAMDRVSEGALHARYTSDPLGFEINDLGQQFNKTVEDLVVQQKEAEKQRQGRELLAQEFRIGREIQKSMLPFALPDFPGLKVSHGYLPALEVSGDFYDIFSLESGQLLIVIADVSGKGISACLFALEVRALLRALAAKTDDLAELVVQVNRLLILDTQESGMFATLWLGVYDGEKLHYASQGHPGALLRRDGRIEELSTGGMALGVDPGATAQVKEKAFHSGDFLLLYTDGVAEAVGQSGKLFGKERIEKVFLQSRDVVEELLQEVHSFVGPAPQADDITLLGLEKR